MNSDIFALMCIISVFGKLPLSLGPIIQLYNGRGHVVIIKKRIQEMGSRIPDCPGNAGNLRAVMVNHCSVTDILLNVNFTIWK